MNARYSHAIGAFAAAIALAATAAAASSAANSAPAPGTYVLKDGTTLFVAYNGRMRMFTAEGQRLPEGEPGLRSKTALDDRAP